MAGKIHHWKHGWIPLDAFARNVLAERKKKHEADRRERYAAHLKATAGKRAAMEQRYLDHQNRLAAKKRPSLALRTTAPRSSRLPAGDKLLGALKADGGFTYNPEKGTLVQVGTVDGVAVARPGTERIVGKGDVSREDFANAVADVIESHGDEFSKGAMLGGWYSEDRDAYMVEVTDVFPDRASAVKAGRERNQEGVFDLKTGDFIDTGGTGDQHPTLTLGNSAILNHPYVDPISNVDSSFSAAADTTVQLIAPSTGPGQKFWPDGVPAIKDVGVFNARDGARLAEAWTVANRLMAGYEALEPNVTSKLVSIAAANGGYMDGLKNKLKTPDSLARKLFTKAPTKGLTPTQYGAKIGDALRYTMIAPSDSFAAGTQSVLDSFRKRGYVVDVENTWTIPNATYRGVNTNLSKDGQTFEVQFHTPESIAVKRVNHKLYKVARSTTATPDEVSAANAAMETNAATLTIPPSVATIR